MTASRACTLAADFLEMLRTVEGRFRDRMDETLSNLWLVAIILLPVTCAMSVWVIELMSRISLAVSHQALGLGISSIPFLAFSFGEKELASLKLIMGLTTILLSIIFSRYIAVIRAGDDKVEFWGTDREPNQPVAALSGDDRGAFGVHIFEQLVGRLPAAKTLVLAVVTFTASYFGLKLIT